MFCFNAQNIEKKRKNCFLEKKFKLLIGESLESIALCWFGVWFAI